MEYIYPLLLISCLTVILLQIRICPTFLPLGQRNNPTHDVRVAIGTAESQLSIILSDHARAAIGYHFVIAHREIEKRLKKLAR